jgi:hypothetical protein
MAKEKGKVFANIQMALFMKGIGMMTEGKEGVFVNIRMDLLMREIGSMT